MFTTARIKLTVWYLLIIMLISIMFSISIYRILTGELERGFYRISERYFHEYGPTQSLIRPEILEPSYLQLSEDRIKWTLIYINLIIFGVSGVGGYILAGVTLKPIRFIIDEQNRFVADASHDLRTPITSLKSEIEVYLRGKKRTIKEAEQLIKSNLEEVNNLQSLSDSLITMAYYQQSPKPQNFKDVSLENIIVNAINKLQKQAKQKNIKIQTTIHDYKIYADQERMVQVVTILLDNAIKYSPENTKISLKTEKDNGFVLLSVTDEGTGINTKDIPHIFDRFYRADSSRTSQKPNGHGLGLSIAKKIISQHKGTIAVVSQPEKGTTFTIKIPTIG